MSDSQSSADVYEYLCIDEFLSGFTDVQSLRSALDLGLIDMLLQQPLTAQDISLRIKGEPQGIALLLNMLAAKGVVRKAKEQFVLTDGFITALKYRDLMEVKIEFSNLLAPDLTSYANEFFTDIQQFMQKSTIFELFDYQRCYEANEENYRLTKRWVDLTTAFTRYESQVGIHHHDFQDYRNLLDIGGNSGEFVLQLCKRHSGLSATVIDLPVVCEIGLAHVAKEPESSRIQFVAHDVIREELPTGYDAVSLKSLLHDWPEEASYLFIQKAWQSLEPGGTVIIFERGLVDVDQRMLDYAALPIFLFARFFRDSSVYLAQLTAAGFIDIELQHIELDMPFYLITARKPL
jgi:SAM-dependent methyltransferase